MELVSVAMRYAERYAAEFGFARCLSRLTRPRTRVPLFARNSPWSCSDPGRMLYRAFLSELASALGVGPCRPVEAIMDPRTCVSLPIAPGRCVS